MVTDKCCIISESRPFLRNNILALLNARVNLRLLSDFMAKKLKKKNKNKYQFQLAAIENICDENNRKINLKFSSYWIRLQLIV